MSAAFTFGSLGDIATILQLAWQLRAVLDGVNGASVEIRTLLTDIDVFVVALQDIQGAIERRRRTLRPDVINGIGASLARCRETLRTICQRIKRNEAQMSGSTWQKYWGSTAWGILGCKRDVEVLRRRLIEHVNTIQTYLALSQANDQDMILHHLGAHGDTLHRIYGIVQDIQERFDVGVPTFRFFNQESGKYCLPLARTSLQRLREVWMAYTDFDIHLHIEKRRNMPWEEALDHLQCQSTEIFMSWAFRTIDCMFFRDASFGQWQVLVYTASFASDDDLIFKRLLERRHMTGESCNCTTGNCSTLHANYRERDQRRKEMAQLYSEAAGLLADTIIAIEPDFDRTKLAYLISDLFHRLPSLDYIRTMWMPSLGAKSFTSAEAVLESLRAAPTIPKYGRKDNCDFEFLAALDPSLRFQESYVKFWPYTVDMTLLTLLVEKCQCQWPRD